MLFYPGVWGEFDANNGFKVNSIFIPEYCKEKSNSMNFQYALLKLNKKAEDKKFIPLREFSEVKNVEKVAILGYPSKYFKVKDEAKQIFEIFQ